jgi:hypothetical protein
VSKLKIILLILVSASAVLLLYYSVSKSQLLTHGFASYYTHSRLLAEGGDMTAAYDSVYFHSKMSEFGFGNTKDLPNLPTGSLIMLPLSFLAPHAAKTMWMIISLAALVYSIFLLFRVYEIKFSSIESPALILIVFLMYPLYQNILLGQVYTMILLLASAALYGLKKDLPLLTAISIALMIILKGYGFYPLAALLFLKQYRVFLYGVLFTVILFLATLPLFGFSAWEMYYFKFYSAVSFGQFAGHTAYQTIGSLLMHTFPFVTKQFMYYISQLIGFTALFYFTKRLKASGIIAAFTLSIAMNVIFAPAAESYHYVLLIPLIFLLGKIIKKKYNSVKVYFTLYIAAALLIMLPFRSDLFNYAIFPVFLIGYFRLYAAMLITLLFLFLNSKIPVSEKRTI